MDEGYEWLKGVADKMKGDLARGAAPAPERLTVRQLLERFSKRKRGELITNHIRNGLERFELHTSPDFANAWLDSKVTIALDPDVSGAPCTPHASDPTLRIEALPAANKKLVSVKPDSTLEAAITKMEYGDYSQLPVMQNERNIKGIVTWKHIGARRSECTRVNQCMGRAEVIPHDTRLLDAMRKVREHGYVLVRGKDGTVTGIVTATDVLHFLQERAESFMLIGEIEGHLRNLIHRKFTIEQLRAAGEGRKKIDGSADLTLGGYVRLLENPANWERLKLDRDREWFTSRLDFVRDIRNEVMHFSPDGLDEDARKEIRDAARFFDELARPAAASPPPAEPDARPLPPATPSGTAADAALPPVSSKPRKSRTPVRVVILGKEHESRNAMEATIRVLRVLAERDPSFLERCSRHEQAKGRVRRYIARTPEELYPDGDEDLRAHRAELPGGWLVGTNMNNDIKRKILRMAAEVAGLTFDEDLVVDF